MNAAGDLHGLGRDPCHLLERVVRVLGGRDRATRAHQRSQPAVPLLLAVVAQGVAHGHRRLLADDAGHAHLVRVEAALAPGLDQDHHAEDPLVHHERHGEPRLLAPAVHVGRVVGRQVGVGARLLDDHAGAQGVHAAGVGPDRVGLADERLGHARHGVALPEAAEPGLAGVRRVLPDDALGGPERLAGGSRHAPQHLVVVDAGGHGAARLQQRLELPRLCAEGALHLVPPGDVLVHAAEAEQLAGLVQHRHAAGEQHHLVPVLVAGAVPQLRTALAVADHALEHRADGGDVLLHHEVERRAPDDLVRGVAEHVRHAVGAGGVAAVRVDLPEPVGRGEREILQALLALAQRELHEPALLHLAGQARVGLLELAHALLERGGGDLGRHGLPGSRRACVCGVFGHGLRCGHSRSGIVGNRSCLKQARVNAAAHRDKMRLWSGSWSGDCRGLQNRLRGDDLVLGGFDSHVAPPPSFPARASTARASDWRARPARGPR